MKYVVMKVETATGDVREFPVIFPKALVHSEVAEALRRVIRRSIDRPVDVEPVSAGFLNSVTMMVGVTGGGGGCHGESESLKLKSRGKEDDELIRGHDYFHGIK